MDLQAIRGKCLPQPSDFRQTSHLQGPMLQVESSLKKRAKNQGKMKKMLDILKKRCVFNCLHRLPTQPPSSPTPSSQSSYSLPMDLITNILLRLPLRSLGKFKCVSKEWLELITDSHFISTYKELHMSNSNILLVKISCTRKGATVDFRALSFDGFRKKHEFSMHIYNDKYIEMLPSKWGLICFTCETRFYVCNPSTQVMVKLPEASYCPLSRESSGIGYIKERDEYVLVHLFDRGVNWVFADFACEVLRLRDGMDCSWKVLDGKCPEVVESGVSVEDVLYWRDSNDNNIENLEIVSFDLINEEFTSFSPPEGYADDQYTSWSLVELQGRLCLVAYAKQPPIMDIWVLKDIENHNWVQEYSIQMDQYNPNMLEYIVPLDFRDGKILMDAKRESLDYY